MVIEVIVVVIVAVVLSANIGYPLCVLSLIINFLSFQSSKAKPYRVVGNFSLGQ